LGYSFRALEPDRLDFADAAPLPLTLGPFECRLEAGRLTARPIVRFETEEEARAKLEPFLRRWQYAAELHDGARVEFSFHGSSVYERSKAGSARRVAAVLKQPCGILSPP
jgi:hypothetical protein